jgi:hypothetical protein
MPYLVEAIMVSRNSLCSAALALLTISGVARADATGVEVLARGPIHEGFAQPIEGQPQASPMIPKEPPPPIDEQPPDQRPEGDNVQWVPGYWQWDVDRADFVWVSGFWRVPPPGRQWIAGYWRKADDGWQWVPGAWISDKQSELNVQPPPPTMVDPGPSTAAPSDDSVYVPGVWVYRDTRYLWRPGYWLTIRAGWVWVPAHYIWTPLGLVYVDGYWDYPLGLRGVLFAPVQVDPAICFRTGWSYTPSYAVSLSFLPGALFVRGGGGHYYFGDYFGTRYLKAGFTPWVDYRIGRAAYDPLFGYYRIRNNSRTWERDVRALYAGRASGDATVPARTLTQQNTLIRNLQTKNVSVTSIQNVTAVTKLTKVTSGPTLTRITNTERAQFTKSAVQMRSLSVQRRETESRILKSNGALRSNDPPRPLKIETPRSTPGPTIRTDPGRPTIRETPHPTTPAPKPVHPTDRAPSGKQVTPMERVPSTPRTSASVVKKTTSTVASAFSSSAAPRVQSVSKSKPTTNVSKATKSTASFKPGAGSKPTSAAKGSGKQQSHH